MDRETFLAHVAAGLGMPIADAAEAIEELRVHLQDAAAGLQERGVAPGEAERTAVERMGEDPASSRRIKPPPTKPDAPVTNNIFSFFSEQVSITIEANFSDGVLSSDIFVRSRI